MSDEFYVGYAGAAPPGIARFLRRKVAAILAVSLGVAAILATAPARFPAKVFEWGEPRTFVGWVQEEPTASLLVRRPGVTGGEAFSRWFLVGPGKHGARSLVAGMHGRLVQLTGALIYRDGQTMLEVVPGSASALNDHRLQDGGPLTTSPVRDLGRHTFVGEIVDSKCYLGVMAPGSTKPHRACATRCISGGVPPVLLVREESGRAAYLLLLSASGGPVNRDVLGLVAEPVEITGSLERHDDLLVLKADPNTYRRVGS